MTSNAPSLFDLFDEPPKVDPAKCAHKIEEKTETDWGPPYGKRLTWTCTRCGRIRGRC
jgi:hypothetical protein